MKKILLVVGLIICITSMSMCITHKNLDDFFKDYADFFQGMSVFWKAEKIKIKLTRDGKFLAFISRVLGAKKQKLLELMQKF